MILILNNLKFCNAFNFEFTETVDTILNKLVEKYTESYFGRRDKPIIYNKEKIL